MIALTEYIGTHEKSKESYLVDIFFRESIIASEIGPTTTDKELLLLISQENKKAFSLIYSKYAGLLCAFLRQKTSDVDLQNDVLQEVFVTVWKKASLYSPERGTPAQWLYTIARNKLFDRWRKTERLKEQTGMEWDRLEDPSAEPDVGELITLKKILSTLSPKDQLWVKLCYLDGKTFEECAKELGVPPSNGR